MLRAAFRDVHGASLHGFALLLTLGDRRHAADLAAEALSDGARRAGSLRHPERAAAWLRRRVVEQARRRSRSKPSLDERRATLASIGVEPAAFDALAALDFDERAALIAGEIERLEPLDLELVLGARRSDVRRRVSRARVRFLERTVAATSLADASGPLGQRIAAIAERTFAARSPAASR